MSLRPVIFISAVSRELRSTRTHVARTLEALGYDVIDQDFAPTDAGDLRGMLRKWVDGTDAVLQIVGRCYGFAPKEADAEFGVCSYTQYEALYARKQGKPVYYIFTEDGHPTDGCGCEPKTLHELQEGYRQQVKGYGDIRYKSDSMDKTELVVRRMDDKLAALRKGAQAHQEQLKQGIDSTFQAVTDSRREIMAGFDGLKQQAQRLPTLAFSPSSWPQASPFHNRGFPDQKNFVGREKLLRAMKKALDAGQDVALTQPVAMHGAGGIGKTRAAVEFVRAHGGVHTLRLFLDAQSPEALRASLADVASKLHLSEDPQANSEALVLLTLRLLRAVPTALVVADNADTPAALDAVRLLCREPGGVRWLITTRLTDLGEEFAAQRVDLLTETEAVKLLQKRARKTGHSPGSGVEASAVVLELGRLPLALQQAGAYVAHQRLTWTAYSALLAANPAQALSHEAKEMKDVPESILRTYNISLQQLTTDARLLLEIAAHFAAAPIREAVFLHEDDGNRRTALVALADLSLLEWQAPWLEVHRAIAIAVRHGLNQDADRQTRQEQACRLIMACAPEDMQHPNRWPAWAALRPHIEHLLAAVGLTSSTEEAYAWLQTNYPNYLCSLGEYAAAAGFYRAALAFWLHNAGAEHPNTLGCWNNLTIVLQEQGRYHEAEQEQRAVLEVRERLGGAEHPETLTSRMGLANILYARGMYAEAEQEYRAVAKVQEDVQGAEHPATLTSRMNLANTLQAQGRHFEAEQEHRSVLQIKERLLGTEHPDTLASLNNVAVALYSQARYAEAERQHRAVLKARAHVLGPQHPDTLASRNNLAITLQAQGKYFEAEQEQRTVLQEREDVLGSKHPAVARSCFNLASCLHIQQKLPEALDLMCRAEQMWTQILGADHPDTTRAKAARKLIEETPK